MKIDLDLIKAILTSCQTRNPQLLHSYFSKDVQRHKHLLLESGFASGSGSGRFNPPTTAEHSLDDLTEAGEHLLAFANDPGMWEHAKDAYNDAEFPWSLNDVYEYLRRSPRDHKSV